MAGLDTLRAVAALGVCFFHFTNGMLPQLVVPATKTFFFHGNQGVDIFFVISGFIIPYSLIGKNYTVAGIGQYLKKRILRINPLAYVSVFLVIAQGLFIDKVINKTTHYADYLSWGKVLSNLSFIVPFTHYTWINSIFWTLAIEFQFYLFISLLSNLLFSRNVGWFIGCYVLVGLLQYLPFAEPIGFLHYSSLFALGGVALLWKQHQITRRVYVGSLLLFTGLALWQIEFPAAVAGIGTALAINEVKIRIPGFSFLGKISYSLYLLHVIVGTTAEFLLVKLLPPTSDARKLLLTALCLGLALGSAYIFYRLVEQPFVRLAAQKRR